jgi:hypothetical protein
MFREAAASTAAAFFVRRPRARSIRNFTGDLIREMATPGVAPNVPFGFQVPTWLHENRRNCCENATHAENIYRNAANA